MSGPFFPPNEDDDAPTPERWAGLLVLHAEAVHGCEHTAIVREGIGMAGPRGEQALVPVLDVERLGRALHDVYCRRNAPMHSEPHHSAGAIAAAYSEN